MQVQPNEKTRERQILNKVVTKAKGKGNMIGAFNPYQKTMVPVPPYMTTGSPTPSDSTSINYSRKGDGDNQAKRAISKIKQFDRGPIAKDRVNKLVGFINDEKKLKGLNK